jgi:hypothetical protein
LELAPDSLLPIPPRLDRVIEHHQRSNRTPVILSYSAD